MRCRGNSNSSVAALVINVENIHPLFGRRARSSNIDSFQRICRLSSVVIQFILSIAFTTFNLVAFI